MDDILVYVMPVTTLRIPAPLKKRLQRAAKLTDKSAHAFVLEAIARHSTHTEQYAKFLEAARRSKRETDAGAKTISLSEAKKRVDELVAKHAKRRG